MFIILFAIVAFLASGYGCYLVAKKNGMRQNTWIAMGLTFGPLGLVLALIASLFAKK